MHFDGGQDAGEEVRVETREDQFQVGQNGEAGNRFVDDPFQVF